MPEARLKVEYQAVVQLPIVMIGIHGQAFALKTGSKDTCGAGSFQVLPAKKAGCSLFFAIFHLRRAAGSIAYFPLCSPEIALARLAERLAAEGISRFPPCFSRHCGQGGGGGVRY